MTDAMIAMTGGTTGDPGTMMRMIATTLEIVIVTVIGTRGAVAVAVAGIDGTTGKTEIETVVEIETRAETAETEIGIEIGETETTEIGTETLVTVAVAVADRSMTTNTTTTSRLAAATRS
jgi:hypothetical protein